MAKCDEGYICEVCGQDVTSIVESDLYLRYVIGEVRQDELTTTPERHIRCNPVLAQFITHADFSPVTVEGPMDHRRLDDTFAQERNELVSRGYARLLEIIAQEGVRDVHDYPLLHE